ncbi:putative gag-polypeptide of LTR copia-type [Lupinus albus]|uniref:Putative gag-polypeptide of LTR copia-type n=1 Tax=Lupinus albus TaxID=3870 RepID=A0A6A4NKQ7_LUPAL|nr:putative gag-polypeptide of LTR copia-type [Lupinus albus]
MFLLLDCLFPQLTTQLTFNVLIFRRSCSCFWVPSSFLLLCSGRSASAFCRSEISVLDSQFSLSEFFRFSVSLSLCISISLLLCLLVMATERDDSLQSISVQLNGSSNYAYWSYVMRNFLIGKRMWGYVS